VLGGLFKVEPELALQHAVDASRALLFPQLHAIAGHLLPASAATRLLARRDVPSLNGALLALAALTLQK